MSLPQSSVDPSLKRLIASSYPDFEARATTAWHEVIKELDNLARVVKEEGVNVSSLSTYQFTIIYPRQYIPEINFNSLDSLSQDEIAKIKRRGTVLIRDVVDDTQALGWKEDLKKFVKVNEEQGLEVEGIHCFETILKPIFNHANQALRLTTSNFSNSCTSYQTSISSCQKTDLQDRLI